MRAVREEPYPTRWIDIGASEWNPKQRSGASEGCDQEAIAWAACAWDSRDSAAVAEFRIEV